MVNGVVIKRFIQMHPERNKTDKKDAKWICRYAINQQPALRQMPDNAYFESKQICNTIRSFTEQIRMLSNQKHSIGLLPAQSREGIKAPEKMIAGFKFMLGVGFLLFVECNFKISRCQNCCLFKKVVY